MVLVVGVVVRWGSGHSTARNGNALVASVHDTEQALELAHVHEARNKPKVLHVHKGRFHSLVVAADDGMPREAKVRAHLAKLKQLAERHGVIGGPGLGHFGSTLRAITLYVQRNTQTAAAVQ